MKTIRDDILELFYDRKNGTSRNCSLAFTKYPGICNDILVRHKVEFQQYVNIIHELDVEGYIMILGKEKDQNQPWYRSLEYENQQLVVLTTKGIRKIRYGGFKPNKFDYIAGYIQERQVTIATILSLVSLIISIFK